MVDLKTIAPLMAILLVWLLVFLRRKQRRSMGYLLCCSAFYIYLLLVAKYTIFPLRLFNHQYTLSMKAQGATWVQGLNLVPFRELTPLYLRSIQGVGNVLLTVPFGFGLPFIVPANLKSIAWKGLCFSISIELTQLVINIAYGFGVRTVDVNDVLLNTLGATGGFGLFCLLSWLYSKLVSPEQVVRGEWSHIHASLTRQRNAVFGEHEAGHITLRP